MDKSQKAINEKVLEQTFVMVKPDGVLRGLIGEVMSRFEKRGLKIVAMKMIKPTLEQIDNHYPKDKEWIHRLGGKGFAVFQEYGLDPKELMGTDDQMKAGESVRKWLIDYLDSAPVVAMVIEGFHAIDAVRKIAGPTLPSKAEVGTIRGDFSIDTPSAANITRRAVKNLVHCSETKEEAKHEIAHWFSDDELYTYDLPSHSAMF
jgi:nucleoside-diphosphate kinase